MDDEPVALPGGRDVRGRLDWPDGDPGAVVVACPPHPQFGGSREDRRLRAVSDALRERGIACLRFDYGPWDGGDGERADARNALGWARERFTRVGLFGYSFGAARALEVAAESGGDDEAVEEARRDETAGSGGDGQATGRVGDARSEGGGPAPDATSALAPDAGAAAVLGAVVGPLQVVYGSRDDTVDWRPVVERARELNDGGREPPVELVELSADHHFVGQDDDVADAVAPFFERALD